MRRNVVLGLGISGQSAARLLLGRGEKVVGIDDALESVKGIDGLCGHGLEVAKAAALQPNDRLVVSPGVPPTHPLYLEAQQLGIEIVGEVELALQQLRCRAIGVTGTNGKTTVTLLIAHVLDRAKALGNVGVPLSAEIETLRPDDWAVIELSSFQLETAKTACLDVALFLNLSADHLDRHPTLTDYAHAKCRIASLLKQDGHLIVQDAVWRSYRDRLNASRVTLFGKEGKEVAFALPMNYTMKFGTVFANVVAAYIACRDLGVEEEQFFERLATFERPPHRMQVVCTVGGMRFINDSKGTNVFAVEEAVAVTPGPIVLIAGGLGKGGEFGRWRRAFGNKVRHVCLIGEAQQAIEAALSPVYGCTRCGSLEEAVAVAIDKASGEGSVLLSPGCSSFDMFTNYAARGEEFMRIVQERGRT